MIAAISFNVNDDYLIRIYLVGTYNEINWDEEYPCLLGEKYKEFHFKNPSLSKGLIKVAQGLDDMYILRIVETKRYMIRVEKMSDRKIKLPHLQNESNKFLKCDRDEDSVLFQFVNYLGRSKIIFDDHEEDKYLQFEVVPDKMNYEDDYIELTESLAQMCSELLLEYSGSTSNVYSQSEDESKTLLEQFIFLRQFCFSQNIQGLFESIKRNPDRILIQEEELRPFGCDVPSKKIFSNPFSYGKEWKRMKSSCGNHYYLPQKIAVTQKKDSLDTTANRFVKYAIERIDSICLKLIEILQVNGVTKQTECLKEAKAIHRMLDNISRDSFFDEVGSLNIMPQNNQVLQKREGYSQIFSAYSMIDIALQLDWKGKDTVYEGESKNVALLYEYWLFFELYKIVKSIDGCKVCDSDESRFITNDKDGITISLSEGRKSCQSFEIIKLNTKINLYYNRSFSRMDFKTTRYEGSYSRPFRPDYTLAIYPSSYTTGENNGEVEAVKNGAVSYIHFDAKYRITDLTEVIGKPEDTVVDEGEGFSEDKTGAIVNTYKRGDLLKMHTYNDAIRRTVGSYVLYPGSGETLLKNNVKFSLFDEILPGVGAFAIKPSINAQGEKELSKFIYSLIQAKEQYSSRLNRMKYYTEMVLREPNVPNLNFNKSSDKVYLDKIIPNKVNEEMCVIGYIRADSDDDYYFSLKNNNLLNIGSEFLFYFYAIKGSFVYTHHKDIAKATAFRFYKNQISETGTYILEPMFCNIESNELISKTELVERLIKQGYSTNEERHQADFYFVLKVRVIDDQYPTNEIKNIEISSQNGNDSFSPHSPKIIYY